jgi:hypothetical protein
MVPRCEIVKRSGHAREDYRRRMPVRTERHGGVLVVQLDRDEKRNAINGEMTESISAALDAGEDDPAVRAIVIAGGPTVFCAGTDIAEGSGTPTDRGGEYGIIRRRSTTPIIAAVEGSAFGGGFEIALACHLIVASSTATFGLPCRNECRPVPSAPGDAPERGEGDVADRGSGFGAAPSRPRCRQPGRRAGYGRRRGRHTR